MTTGQGLHDGNVHVLALTRLLRMMKSNQGSAEPRDSGLVQARRTTKFQRLPPGVPSVFMSPLRAKTVISSAL